MGDYKNLLHKSNDILNSIRNVLKEASNKKKVEDAEVSLKETNTPEFKEGLVIYFSNLSKEELKIIEEKLSLPDDDQEQIEISFPSDETYYGKKSFDLVNNAIRHLSENIVPNDEKRFYYNALSIAKKIQESFGEVQADRGDTIYSKLRKKAVQLISEGYGVSINEDKWCPADIYIYNDNGVPTEMLAAKTLNIGEKSFNAYFQSDINKKGDGLVGISLKEEKAQAGKATSFFNTLERKENYPDAPSLIGETKYILSISYNYGQVLDNISKDPKKAIGYITTAHASADIISSKSKEAKVVADDLLKILKKTFGSKDLSGIKNANGRYDKDKARELFSEKDLDSFSLPPSLKKNINSLFNSYRKKYETNYKNARKQFLDVLKKNNMDAPVQTPDISVMNMETLLKKTSCYMVASWVLDGINSKSLNIPNIYQTIIKEKNAFVAMTAYAIGMAGISPTFFKFVGNAKGGTAHVETFYGSGFLNLDEKQKVIIGDTPDRKGFFVEFITTVKLEESETSKPVSKYKVSLDFRYAGEQINIEVSKLKSIE